MGDGIKIAVVFLVIVAAIVFCAGGTWKGEAGETCAQVAERSGYAGKTTVDKGAFCEILIGQHPDDGRDVWVSVFKLEKGE
jgi:hypothetical protein